MNPTAEEIKTLFKTEREAELFYALGEVEHDLIMAKIRIEDLEAQNKILIETGHWIGQDEAHDLKVAVQKFLEYARIGGLGSDSKGVIFVHLWQMQELRDALNNCNDFKSYSAKNV